MNDTTTPFKITKTFSINPALVDVTIEMECLNCGNVLSGNWHACYPNRTHNMTCNQCNHISIVTPVPELSGYYTLSLARQSDK